MTLRFPAGILVNLGEVPKSSYPNKLPTTRMGTASLIRTAFTQAQNQQHKRAAGENGRQTAAAERQTGRAGSGTGRQRFRSSSRPTARTTSTRRCVWRRSSI